MRAILDLLPLARQQGIPIYFTTMAYGSPAEAGEVILPQASAHPRDAPRQRAGADRPELDRQPHEPLIEEATSFGVLRLQPPRNADQPGRRHGHRDRLQHQRLHPRNLRERAQLQLSRHRPAREAVGDPSASAHEANLFDIDARYADVVPLQEVCEHLRSYQTASFVRPTPADRGSRGSAVERWA